MPKIRYPLFLLALLGLLLGMWAGLLRMGWDWPALRPNLAALHGALMISGFLGTLICLERAVASSERWTTLLPLLSGLGTLLLLLGLERVGIGLLCLAAAGLAQIFIYHARQQAALHTLVLFLGAVLWFVGNALWLFGRPVPFVVYWWAGFVILTIAGERLELSRVLRQPRSVKLLFAFDVLIFLAGLVWTFFDYNMGVRICGLGMVLIASWLLLYDLARYNLRKPGLTGYIAVCLFSGYIWLLIAGLLAMVFGGVAAGLAYDAILHAIFLGFAFGMIFGHAPIIFPAVLGSPLPYRPAFYIPLILLQVTLVMRLAGDLLGMPVLRQWGGLLNVFVLLLFVAMMGWSVVNGKRTTDNGQRATDNA